MQIGDRVIDIERIHNGIGTIIRIHNGGSCTVLFEKHNYVVPLASLMTPSHGGQLVQQAQWFFEKNQAKIQLGKQHILEEAQREKLLNEIHKKFTSDFLGADLFFDNLETDLIPTEDYKSLKNNFIKTWFAKNSPDIKSGAMQLPDEEQLAAIGSVCGNVQVVARAGSGKTSTLVNRAFFLQKHCNVQPSEILLLAFNRKAAKEIEDRLKQLCGDTTPYAMTFHALAHAIVHPSQELIYNDSTEKNQGLDSVFRAVIRDRLSENDFLADVRELMIAQFTEDWESLVEGGYKFTPEELFRFQKNLARETLRGEYVKSHGEKVIANFCFEHDIPYSYEKSFYLLGGRIYKPDFTLSPGGGKSQGVVIEYFGMVGKPEYDKEIKIKKKYWTDKDGYTLIDIYPSAFKEGEDAFESELKRQLQNLGVTCTRLSDEQIWLNIKLRVLKRFSSAMSGFIGRCRKAWVLPDRLETMIATHESISEIESKFLDLSVILYNDYLTRLNAEKKQDFDGLMQEAVQTVGSGKTTFERKNASGDLAKLRYVFIDEFQDFSELFHRLIEAIRCCNPELKIFCVGDDWQAINGFAGSDLKFYKDFDSYFPQTTKLHISTNYRSLSSIVAISNELMAERGKPANAYNKSVGETTIVNLSDFPPSLLEQEQFRNGTLTPVILRLAGKALSQNKSVALLSRRKDLFLPSGGYMSIEKYLGIIRKLLPETWRDRITISTTHSFKGRECDVVIIIDAMKGKYPLLHPNWIFTRILGENLNKLDEENRRLFYVALTRAKDTLFIITENNEESPYLNDIQKTILPKINWQNYPPIIRATNVLVVRITGHFFELTDELKADGYQFRRLPPGGKAVREKKYQLEGFDEQALQHTPWANKAKQGGFPLFFVSIIGCNEIEIEKFYVDKGIWTQ